MQSTIRVEFHQPDGQKGFSPFIKVSLAKKSTDLKDQWLITFFQELNLKSDWLKVVHEGEQGDTQFKHIYPVRDEELPKLLKDVQDKVRMGSIGILDNSTGFHQFLKENNIPYAQNDHYTMIADTIDLFNLGMQYQKYKQKEIA